MMGPVCRDLQRAIDALLASGADEGDERVIYLRGLMEDHGCNTGVVIEDLAPPTNDDIENYRALRDSVDDLIERRGDAVAGIAAANIVLDAAKKVTT
tara:strand:+ start:670 stop:960 length:291 start_codon:yes stop_codon:yes gene_type:complete